ncbi:MAG: MFS transporter, partial [Candidatus Lokiarchaeota archaeon]|nr:MFS transporter [Candidatus Lokiarchaeota archaeon]
PSTLITSYLSIFYIYTVGLNPLLVSIGTALGSIANAFCGPIFGYVSDKKRATKLGKRRQFLLYGLPLLIVTLILVWLPPLCSELNAWNFQVAIFLWIFVVTFYINYSLIRSPYLAMLPEQSEVEENRVQISSIQGIFNIVATVLGVLLPMFLQSLLDKPAVNGKFHNTPNGQILLDTLPIVALVFGVISTIFTLITFFSVDESFLIEKERKKNIEKKGIKEVIKNIFKPLTDKDYLVFLISVFAMNTGMRLIIRILAPYFEFILLFDGNDFIFFALGLIPFAGLGFAVWSKKAKNKGLKESFLKANGFMVLCLMSTIILVLINISIIRTFIALIIMGLAVYNLVPGYIFHFPMVSIYSDQASDNENTKSKSSGKYFGALLFIYNIANAIGDLIMGLILMGEMNGVPNSENALIIAVILPVAALLYFASVLVYRNARLKKEVEKSEKERK